MITGLPLNDLIPEVAAAMCQGLFGCCDMTDHESFLLSFQNTPRYEEVVDQLPPTVAFDENSCPSMIETILTAAPFGRWIEQVNEQRVSYDGDAAQSCLDTLNNAQCGDEFITALYDGTCLSPFPPFGGEDQRKMFSRTDTAGESCVALTDGQGGVIFGTCDPNTAFCCVRRDDNTCKIPEQDEVGECVAVSDLGEPCSILPSAQVCATGKECGFESGVCEPATEYIDVQLGEECAEDYSFFGVCQDSYCDITGTGTCLPDHYSYSSGGTLCNRYVFLQCGTGRTIFPYNGETSSWRHELCGRLVSIGGYWHSDFLTVDGPSGDQGVDD